MSGSVFANTKDLVKFLQCPDIVIGEGHITYWPVKGDEDGSLKIYPMIGGYILKSDKGEKKWMVKMYFKGDEDELNYWKTRIRDCPFFFKGEITSPKEAKRWIAEKFPHKSLKRMYLRKITIRNIKSTDISIQFANDPRKWTSILGGSGTGKSTILKAIGIALAGPIALRELIPYTGDMVRVGEPYGEIIAEIIEAKRDKSTQSKKTFTMRYIVANDSVTWWAGDGTPGEKSSATKQMKQLQKTAYSVDGNGWLACGYGPYRKISGGSQEANRIFCGERISARFITLFRDDAAFTNLIDWIIRLHNTAREGDLFNSRILKAIKNSLGSLFSKPSQLITTADSVSLKVLYERPIPLYNLSDGYKSIINLIVDIIKWIFKSFPETETLTDCPGIVLIDEVDAHLNQSDSHAVRGMLSSIFPRIQFITTTNNFPQNENIFIVDLDKKELNDGTFCCN